MHFPRYWGKGTADARSADGQEFRFACWRGSDSSVAEAEAAARRAATGVAERAARGEPIGAYEYGEAMLREEVLRQLGDGAADGDAVVTRNSFGCLVLNTARVMFVDVDLPPAGVTSPVGLLKRLVGRKTEADDPAAQALARLESWVGAHRGAGFRIYRTRAGLRYLETSRFYDPGSRETEAVLEALGCDPLYVRLCRAQKSFRARLTPKPWRCDLTVPPSRFPHESVDQERAFRDWLAKYDAACAELATCAYVTSVGADRVHSAIAPLLRVHDDTTRASSGLPIA